MTRYGKQVWAGFEKESFFPACSSEFSFNRHSLIWSILSVLWGHDIIGFANANDFPSRTAVETLPMFWKPDRLLRAILIWTAVTLVVVWLPVVRGLMDGESYQWGNSLWGMQIGGRGVRGDYWILLIQAALGIFVLYLGWRGARPPFHGLLMLWHILLAAQACYNSFTSPEDYRFQGDTLGVDVSLAWVGPVLFGGFALLAIFWVLRDLRTRQETVVPEWSRANFVFLLIVLALIPIQFVLLRFGEPHGPRDQVGVILTMTQWILINCALFPWSGSKRAADVVERV